MIDGDSLTRLARRYLGNAARWREIFEANAGVLEVPDVLPIGVELRITPTNTDRPQDRREHSQLVPIEDGSP